jgi:hypothetical protein
MQSSSLSLITDVVIRIRRDQMEKDLEDLRRVATNQ